MQGSITIAKPCVQLPNVHPIKYLHPIAVVIAQLGHVSGDIVCPNGLVIVLPSTRVVRDRCASEGREKSSR